MLSAATLTPDRGAYLEESVAWSRDDYYAGRGESPGVWFGSAAGDLGLAGLVEDGALVRLIDGCHPATGARLRRPVAARRVRVPSLDPVTGERVMVEQVLAPVGGFDLVFSAPKSVSLAAALAPRDVRREVAAAHHAAVTATLGLLEREACGVRLGHGGTERAKGSGIVAALYTHRTSRARDPQLHTHCAVANLTQGLDGRWRALDSRLLLSDWKLALGYAYQAALRDEITRRLGWTWHEPVKGLAELERWPQEALREMSTRRRAIEAALATHGGRSWEAGQVATLATRAAKTLDGPDLEKERETWRARLAEHGMGVRELDDAFAPGPAPEPVPREQLRQIAEELAGPTGLTEHANAFRRPDVVRGFAAALPSGTTVEHLEQLADWFLTRPDLAVPLADGAYTAPDLLACEARLLDLAERGRDARTAILPRLVVERALRDAPVELSNEQADAVRGLTTSGHAIENLEARAGSGKTTVCGVIANAYRACGYHVIGATPTARAARELTDAGVPATTIDAILTRQRATPTPAPRRLVILADENGMAGTRQMSELATWARRSDAKIIQVGDSHQLAAVPASGTFAEITRRHGARELTEVRRQRDPAEIDALAALRHGDAETYLRYLIQHDRLILAPNETTAITEAAHRWQDAADRHGAYRVALICRTNELRQQLNTAVRATLLADGELDGPAVETPSGAFRRGDRIVCRHNDRTLDLDNGTRATVTHADATRHRLEVRADDGRRLRIPRAYLDAGHVEHAYALTAHALQGATVSEAIVVTRPDDHDQRWTYTASSRARGNTTHVLIDGDADTQGLARSIVRMGAYGEPRREFAAALPSDPTAALVQFQLGQTRGLDLSAR